MFTRIKEEEAPHLSLEGKIGRKLDHYRKFNPIYNAFIPSSVNEDKIWEKTKRSVAKYSQNTPRPLEGLLISIKDNICVKDTRTTAGSKILSNFDSTYESTVTERLWKAGAIYMGKTNMDEFGMGSATLTSYYGESSNPYNTDYVCGGSSGGSAISVAKNMCYASIGTDTGGSIRQPAAFCGIVGLKPTYGRCSRWGVIAYASSFDTVGVMAESVRDTALILETIAGDDLDDSTSSNIPVRFYSKYVDKDIKGLRIGVIKSLSFEDTQFGKKEKDRIQNLLSQFAHAGCVIKEVEIPHIQHSLPIYYILACAEASSNLARYDGVKYGLRVPGEDYHALVTNTRSEGFGDEVKKRILGGTFVLSSGYYDAYYTKASQVRNLLKQETKSVFEEVDVLFSPVTPSYPFTKESYKNQSVEEKYRQDQFTVFSNLVGIPALSIPLKLKNEDTFPFSFQLMGKWFDEMTLFQLGHFFQTQLLSTV